MTDPDKKTASALVLAVVAAMALAACENTIRGAGEDIEAAGDEIEAATE